MTEVSCVKDSHSYLLFIIISANLSLCSVHLRIAAPPSSKILMLKLCFSFVPSETYRVWVDSPLFRSRWACTICRGCDNGILWSRLYLIHSLGPRDLTDDELPQTKVCRHALHACKMSAHMRWSI